MQLNVTLRSLLQLPQSGAVIVSFRAKWSLMSSDTMVKKDLPLRGSLQNDAREKTACKTILPPAEQ